MTAKKPGSRILAALVDAAIAVSFSVAAFFIFFTALELFPYRFAERILESRFLAATVILPATAAVAVLLFVVTGQAMSGRFTIRRRLMFLAVVIAAGLSGNWLLKKAAGAAFGHEIKCLERIADEVCRKTGVEIRVQNDCGFEAVFISDAFALSAEKLRENGADARMAKMMEFKSRDSGTLTVKAVKAGKVFRTERPNPGIRVNGGFCLAAAGREIRLVFLERKKLTRTLVIIE
ncbi:MAG TPA: hypothetical protein P5511_01200 [Candidatus Goldiibacteriota bacterium]|nr:hypothetical protein [Candidatus Goldiibacteriota bacterium]